MMDIDAAYYQMKYDEMTAMISTYKKTLGRRLCIMAHYYQNDDIIQFADFVGDSLYLSQKAAAQNESEFIVFCGVRFMAESAHILSAGRQTVCLPNMSAGCAMSDMADAYDVGIALAEVNSLLDGKRVVPVSYVNSSAEIKAITFDWGGSCCTSSNVRRVIEWALASATAGGGCADKVFGLPDRHLIFNTIVSMGYTKSDFVIYDPALPDGGLTAEKLAEVKFIIWPGHCYVHNNFSLTDVARVCRDYKDVRIIVHPECPHEVVMAADKVGSTAQIIRYVEAEKIGANIAIGTEINLVKRLAKKHPDKNIICLADNGTKCYQMARIDMPHLLHVLASINSGSPANVIRVPEHIASKARGALDRMISFD